MADLTQLERALLQAHRTGDDRAAKLIASRIQGGQANEYAGEDASQTGTLTNLTGGLKHAWDKAAYGLEGAVKGLFGQDIDPEHVKQLQQGKAFVNKAGGAAKVGEFVGDVLPYAAGGAGAIRAGLSLPMSMAMQSGIGATVTPESLGERLKSGALAGVGEGVGGVLSKTLGKMVGGVSNIDPAAQRLIDEGIYPTLGGLKPSLKGVEDKLTSMPLLGSAINMGRRGAIDEANLAALTRGGIPEEAVNKIGQEGFEQLGNYFNKQFGDALEGVRFDMYDPAIQQAIDQKLAEAGAQSSTIDTVNSFFKGQNAQRGINTAPSMGSTLMNEQAARPLATGKDFHNLLRDLRERGQTLRRSSVVSEQDAGKVLRGMYDELQGIARNQGLSEKGALDAFDAARAQYAATAPAMRAGNLNVVGGQHGGVFTPKQYANANAVNMKQMGQTTQFRTGQGQNQQFAEDMVKALGNNYPDSGTAGRALTGLAVGGGLGYIAPTTLGVGLPALGAAALLNTAKGRRYLAGALPGQKALADKLRGMAPYTGAAGAALLGPLGSDY